MSGCLGLALWVLLGAATPRAQVDDHLLVAAQRGEVSAIRSALADGADVNATDEEGATPLFWAAHDGDTEAVQTLLNAGAQVEGLRGVIWTDTTRTGYFGSPLAVAAGRGHAEIVRQLVAAGAEVDAREWNPESEAYEGWTALEWAVNEGDLVVASVLLAAGADPNTVSPVDGSTPLLIAARARNGVSARQLVCAGADVEARDADGRDAASYLGGAVQTAPPCTPANAARFGDLTLLVQQTREAWETGDKEETYQTYSRYTALADSLLGPTHPWTLRATRELGHLAYQTERAEEALERYQAYLAVRDTLIDNEEALMLNDRVVDLLMANGRFAEAGPYLDRSIPLWRAQQIPNELAKALLLRGAIAKLEGDMASAEAAYTEVLSVSENEERLTLYREQAQQQLATLYAGQQRSEEARPLIEDLIASIEARDGVEAESLISPLSSQGIVAVTRGDWEEAVEVYTRILQLIERHRGAEDPSLIQPLVTLARIQGYQQAVPAMRTHLDRAQGLCEQHAQQASSDCQEADAALATLSRSIGDGDSALRLLREAVERLGPDADAEVRGGALYRLAEEEARQGDLDSAEAHYREALAALDEAEDAGQTRMFVRDALADLLDQTGRSDAADALRREIPDVDLTLVLPPALEQLNRVLSDGGSLDSLSTRQMADDFVQRIRALEALLGADNPDLADEWTFLALLQMYADDMETARASALRGATLATAQARNGLAAMSLAEQRLFLDGTLPDQVATLAQVFDPASYPDWSVPYDYVFRWKGLLFQTLRREAALGRLAATDPELAELRERLLDVRRAFVAASGEEAAQLAIEKEALERQLASRLPEAEREDPLDRLGLEGFLALLPADAAFLDVYRIQPEGLAPSYVFVLMTPGAPPLAVEIEADDLDARIAEWHDAAASGQSAEEALQVMTQIGQVFASFLPDGTRRLWVSPDGATGRMPWAVAMASTDLAVAQVASPRALAALLTEADAASGEAVLLVGDVDFGSGDGGWSALPGTAVELDRLEAMAEATGQEVSPLRQLDPTPRAVASAMRGARYVHLATHGFVARRGEGVPSLSSRGLDLELAPEDEGRISRNPLAESGLALAGANAGPEGLLTAEELVGIDLSGTRLVTLSACETGRGAEVTGQGVLGLQASLTTAGARAVLMSLWSVPDASTAALMEAFYRGLWTDGLSPADALAAAQAEVRATPGWEAPVHWAAWVLTGDAFSSAQ